MSYGELHNGHQVFQLLPTSVDAYCLYIYSLNQYMALTIQQLVFHLYAFISDFICLVSYKPI